MKTQILVELEIDSELGVIVSSKSCTLPCEIYYVLKDIKPYVDEMIGIASSARTTLDEIESLMECMENDLRYLHSD